MIFRPLFAALVPRTRSSLEFTVGTVANFGFKSGTRIIELLVSFSIPKVAQRSLRMLANFGIGTLAVVSVAAAAEPARAADAVFPLASHIGLVAPAGMTPSKTFRGFEDRAASASILILEIPSPALPGVEKQMTPETLKKEGMVEEKRETVTVNGAKGLLLGGTQESDGKKVRKWLLLASWPEGASLVAFQVPDENKGKYPDASVRAALMSVTLRQTVPVDEQLRLVPVQFDELSGMRPFRVLGNSSVFLTDGAADPKEPAEQPLFIVTVAPGGPEETSDRANFSRQLFAGLNDFKDLRIVGTDVLRLDNVQTYEIQAEAKDPKSDAPLKLVQWIRFGNGAFIRFVGIARADSWAEAFPKFRAVRDGTKPRG